MRQINCEHCGQVVTINDGEEAYDLCWKCANEVVDKLRNLVAINAGCDADADRPGCVAWATGSCQVKEFCDCLVPADKDSDSHA